MIIKYQDFLDLHTVLYHIEYNCYADYSNCNATACYDIDCDWSCDGCDDVDDCDWSCDGCDDVDCEWESYDCEGCDDSEGDDPICSRGG